MLYFPQGKMSFHFLMLYSILLFEYKTQYPLFPNFLTFISNT